MTVTTNKIVTGSEVGTGVISAFFLRVNAPLDYTSHTGVSSTITVVAGIPGTEDGGGGGEPGPMSIFMDFNALGVIEAPDNLPVAGPFSQDNATVSGVYAYHPVQADEFQDIIPASSTTGYVANRGRFPETIQTIVVALDTPLTSVGRYIKYIEFKHASYGTTTLRAYNAGGLVQSVELTPGSILAPYTTIRLPDFPGVYSQAQAITHIEMTTPGALTAIDDLFIQLTLGP